MASKFGGLPDMTPSGVIPVVIDPDCKVFSEEPLVLQMKIAHVAWNKDYREARAARGDEHAAAQGDDDKLRTLRCEIFADSVIVGWKNCNTPEGTPVAYSPADAKDVLAELVATGWKLEIDDAFVVAMNVRRFRRSAIVDTVGK